MTQAFPVRMMLSVFAAMTLIVGGDVAAKMLSQVGFSPFLVAWARFALAALILLPFCGVTRPEWRTMLDWRLLLRAGLIAAGISSIVTALQTEALANVFAGFFIGPIVSFLLSAWLLRERVTPLRAILLGVSFVGVLIVVRPGFGMTFGMGMAVLAGCFHGSYLVATRWLAGSFRPRFLLLSQLLIGTIILLPLAWGPIPDITGDTAMLLVISAMGSAIGNLIIVLVNRTTPAGVVAPLIYSQLVAAAGFGWIFFGEWPDIWVGLGLVVILCAGAGSAWAAGRGR